MRTQTNLNGTQQSSATVPLIHVLFISIGNVQKPFNEDKLWITCKEYLPSSKKVPTFDIR